ncbi:hypothetical protein J3R73_003309 [Labrys monachus]|uniref:Uncharacterized protein n=1 Tax=Labrys monachus TaxID=217067 RepID=A0ABU0FFZ3_9HYPH|nr:hypothetical protein [Labrys monachus]
MKKGACEAVIRHLCHQWHRESGLTDLRPENSASRPFLSWAWPNYSSYLDFRTTTSVSYDVEMWFADEFRQHWHR